MKTKTVDCSGEKMVIRHYYWIYSIVVSLLSYNLVIWRREMSARRSRSGFWSIGSWRYDKPASVRHFRLIHFFRSRRFYWVLHHWALLRWVKVRVGWFCRRGCHLLFLSLSCWHVVGAAVTIWFVCGNGGSGLVRQKILCREDWNISKLIVHNKL